MTATIHASCQLPNGQPAKGFIVVEVDTTNQTVRDPVGNVVFTGPMSIRLVAGEATFTLPATDDATLSPTGFTYTATEHLDHVFADDERVVVFAAPDGTTVELADLASDAEAVNDPDYTPGVGIDAFNALSMQVGLIDAELDGVEAGIPTQIQTAIDAIVAGAPGALDTLNELATALLSDEGAAASLTALVGNIRNLTDATHNTALAATIATAIAVPAQGTRRASIADKASYGAGQWFVHRSGPTELHFWREDLTEPGCYYDWWFADKFGDGGATLTPRLRTLRRGILMRAEHVGTGVTGPPAGYAVNSPLASSDGYPQGGAVVLRGSMTAGSAVFTVTAGGPLVQGIHRSRNITIPGAGPAGAALTTAFQAAPSGGSATLAAAASTTVTDVLCILWADYWLSTGAAAAVTGPAHTCKALGFMAVRHNNTAGLFKVTISDGSVANQLPTAQQVVNDGLYPNTILVANGGTLAPTDRVWSALANKINYTEPICCGRWDTSASRSLILTATGYAATGTTGGTTQKSIIAGWLWADGTETPTTGGDLFVAEVDLLMFDGNDVMNYMHNGGGAGAAAFVGGEHGYEPLEAGPTITVDGTVVTVGQWQAIPINGECKVALTTTARHPSATATDFWRTSYVYRLTRRGLAVHHANVFLAATTMTRAWPFMLALNSRIFDRGQVDTSATPLVIPPAVADVFVGQSRGTAYAMYDFDGTLMAALIIPEAQSMTANWNVDLFPGNGGAIENRAVVSGTAVNKAYIGRSTNPVAGEVWDNDALFVFGRNRAGTALMFPVA